MVHYYGTVPVLAWILNHYFYRGIHFAWLAEGFHPLLTNPKSSNPYLIYDDLYWPWVQRDTFDRFVAGARLSLRTGVIHHEIVGTVDPETATRLKAVCQRVAVDFFYPVVYRVDMDTIEPGRRVRAGSAVAAGSREYLVPDLAEAEFDLLFADNTDDPDFRCLVTDRMSGTGHVSPEQALTLLEGREQT